MEESYSKQTGKLEIYHTKSIAPSIKSAISGKESGTGHAHISQFRCEIERMVDPSLDGS
jgi:hypothetical protein